VYAAYASHAHQRCKTPGLLGQCWKRWIAGGAGHTQLLLAVERHAMAQSCTLYYHTTVNDSPKACCRRQPHELQPIFYFYYAARLTCDDMALTATWLTSSPCHHRYAMTMALLSTAQHHSWFCFHVFPASTCAVCWPARPPPMPHPNTTCSWRGSE
jgi:hypothetical protein